VIGLIDYGSGNLRSVHRALVKVGADTRLVHDAAELAECNGIVLPGVGAFDDCLNSLRAGQMLDGCMAKIQEGIPFLGICVGYQALFQRSHEFNSSAAGLGLFEGEVVSFPHAAGLKVPQIGWNQLQIAQSECPLYRGVPNNSYVYFVHSFYPVPRDKTIVATWTEYGGPFASSVWRRNVYGTQFHPEKSQEVGLRILRNFVEICS
jgi:glutamine amidotransferase